MVVAMVLGAAAVWMLVQLSRMTSVRRKGVPAEAVCDHNKWNERRVASVCVFTPEGGEPIEVQTSYYREPALAPGDRVKVLYNPSDPQQAILPDYAGNELLLIWIAVAVVGGLSVVFAVKSLVG
ncbi:DUF3592 domain-containing protein [Streptomyces caatingaensis]|uniref:DUF3592 domain-containing protein n=1 Tax=Streptomyces caatingaensis TaxID=1678637 RepID=UPI0012FF5243|nr:DUF3592 domain-containing protein [Streptomyces caatingaensis]